MNTTRTVIVAATLVLSSCQGGGVTSATATEAGSPPALATATTEAAATVPSTISSPSPAPSPSTDAGANPFGGHAPEDRLMPSVVCMNLQDAQNEIQDQGVFGSNSKDATGRDRNQIIDSNWQVVAQSPDVGTSIGEFDATLFVVKYGEQPNPC
ncbi:MAG: PASTA domain-containing protein [Ilumatobacteraceae bacterium]